MELKIEQVLQQGVDAQKKGKLQDAERLYREILQSHPAHPEANHNLGVLAVSESKADTALPLFKTALEANPKIVQFWVSYIETLIKEKHFDSARQVLAQAKKQDVDIGVLNSLVAQISPKTEKPNSAEVPPQQLLNSLMAQYQNGRLGDAEKLSIEITQDFPRHGFAWKVLGAVLEATGRKSEAVDANQKAVELSPQDAAAHFNLGNTLKELSRFDEAEARYIKATTLKPDFVEAHFNLGNMLKELGRMDAARASYIQAIVLKPSFAEAHFNLGITLREIGRLNEAEASYKQAIKSKPDFVEAHYNLGNMLRELGRLDEAEASYRQVIALKPDYAEAYSNLGNTLQELCRSDEAEESYSQAINLRPNFVEAYYNLGKMLKELGRLDEAEARYRQAIALKPDYTEAYGNLGNTLQELGRLDEAESNYRQAILLKPDFAEAHNNLGFILQEQGKLNEAEVSYRQAITLKPNRFIDAYDHLGVILQKKGVLDEAEVCFKKWSSFKPKGIAKTVSKGTIFFKQGLFEQALEAFESYDDPMSKAQVLESLCALERVDEIYSRLEAGADYENQNIRIAAIAAFLAEQEKKDTAHNFCNKPMAFLHFGNIYSKMQNYESFNTSVIDELQHAKSEWEGQTTKNGAHGTVNIFENPLPNISVLHKIILNEIDIYYSKFKKETCSFIQKWPTEKKINGWHVILSTQGYHTPHIHPTGWLSGVVYLKVVPDLGKNEGAIKFSLNGPNYHHKNSPSYIFQPKVGDIALFPSSLHHKTIPFSTDTERIMISFDLQPANAKVTSEKI